VGLRVFGLGIHDIHSHPSKPHSGRASCPVRVRASVGGEDAITGLPCNQQPGCGVHVSLCEPVCVRVDQRQLA